MEFRGNKKRKQKPPKPRCNYNGRGSHREVVKIMEAQEGQKSGEEKLKRKCRHHVTYKRRR